MLAEIEICRASRSRCRSPASRSSSPKTPAEVRRRAPDLGEDTLAVLRAHGASEADIAGWAAAGAIMKDDAR